MTIVLFLLFGVVLVKCGPGDTVLADRQLINTLDKTEKTTIPWNGVKTLRQWAWESPEKEDFYFKVEEFNKQSSDIRVWLGVGKAQCNNEWGNPAAMDAYAKANPNLLYIAPPATRQGIVSGTFTGISDYDEYKAGRPQVVCLIVACIRANKVHGVMSKQTIKGSAAGLWTDRILDECPIKSQLTTVSARDVPGYKDDKYIKPGQLTKNGQKINTIFYIALVADIILAIIVIVLTISICKE